MKNLYIIFALVAIGLISGCTNQQGGVTRQSVTVSPPAILAPTPSPNPTVIPSPTATPRIIGEYSTKISSKKMGRVNNINLAVDLINGKIIKNNEVFSFNDAVGPTTKERGFEEAVVYVEGDKDVDYGGGVCQVSTTLYNAADLAGIKIVERHPHKGPIYYAPKGRDAAVSYGGVDLKIKNTLETAVIIEATANSNSVIVRIYEKN